MFYWRIMQDDIGAKPRQPARIVGADLAGHPTREAALEAGHDERRKLGLTMARGYYVEVEEPAANSCEHCPSTGGGCIVCSPSDVGDGGGLYSDHRDTCAMGGAETDVIGGL